MPALQRAGEIFSHTDVCGPESQQRSDKADRRQTESVLLAKSEHKGVPVRRGPANGEVSFQIEQVALAWARAARVSFDERRFVAWRIAVDTEGIHPKQANFQSPTPSTRFRFFQASAEKRRNLTKIWVNWILLWT